MRSSRSRSVGIAIDLGGALGAFQADVTGADEDVGIADVDQRCLDGTVTGDVEPVDRIAGRQQRARRAASRIGEIDQQARAAAGHAGDPKVPRLDRHAIMHGDLDRQHPVQVRVVDPDGGDAVDGRDQVLLDGIDADGRGDVAAQREEVDLGFVDFDLTERVGEMRAGGAGIMLSGQDR